MEKNRKIGVAMIGAALVAVLIVGLIADGLEGLTTTFCIELVLLSVAAIVGGGLFISGEFD